MEELREKIVAKKEEIREKYADVINEVAVQNKVDCGVAFDMVLAVARGGEYTGEIEFDKEALKKDYAELVELEEELIKGLGV